jgi:hypothetical protein
VNSAGTVSTVKDGRAEEEAEAEAEEDKGFAKYFSNFFRVFLCDFVKENCETGRRIVYCGQQVCTV